MRIRKNYKDDKLHGPQEWFHENGNLVRIKNYDSGKLHGNQIDFHLNGNLEKIENYIDGELVLLKTKDLLF